MQHTLRWLERHRRITLILAAVYYAFGVLFHERVNLFCHAIRESTGNAVYQNGLSLIFGTMLVLLSASLVRGLVRGKERAAKLAYAAFSVSFLILGYHTLFIFNTEAVHFVQYGGLAILLYLLLGGLGRSILWTTILGALDEAYQYWVLYADRFTWFDFNDVILNILGAAIGCVCVWILACSARERPRLTPAVLRRGITSPVWLLGLAFLLAPVAAYSAGLLVRFPADKSRPWQIVLARRFPDPNRFWETTPWGKTLHNLSPAEGMLLTTGLIALYLPMDVRLRRARPCPQESTARESGSGG